MDEYLARFRGIAALYGLSKLQVLKKAKITIVGIGGVGSWAAEAMVRTGIGKIRLIDHDSVNITNTNRQIHASNSNIGKTKVEVMSDRLKDINPQLEVEYSNTFINQHNLETFFPAQKCKDEYVIEAIDSIPEKTALINHLKRNKYRFIVSGGAGGKTDSSQICVSDLSTVSQDPLLAKIRENLRNDYGFTARNKHKFGIRCVYIQSPKLKPSSVNTPDELKIISNYFDDNIVTFGTCMMVTATLGLALAREITDRIVADDLQ
jgi:tRNA A37 threonylcarbamoyladenosine dehydratase